MKKILAAIAAVALTMYPSICLASYIIHLKNGREFVTERYWEEGEQIKFKKYGGIIAIQKNLVKKIEEIEGLPEEKVKTMPKEQGKPKEELHDEKRKGEREKKAKKIDVAGYEKQKAALMEKYLKVREKYERAIKAEDKLAREVAETEMSELLKKLSEVERKLKKEEAAKK